MTVANGEYAIELQVRWSDCDPAGVAYYANYFTFCEAAVVAFMDERGTSWHAFLEVDGVRFPRVDASCRYLASVTFGDRIRVRFRMAELRARVATLTFAVDRLRDGVLAAEGRVVIVCVPRAAPGSDGPRAIDLPAAFRAVFAPVVGGPQP
ncbi:MAG TPA: thioesterase family protein [Candidatus Limnocylindria bacterium]|nr:thioesterase family protein [Candidatus Limnocylindria bacterium]